MPWGSALREMLSGGCVQQNDTIFDNTACYIQDCGLPLDTDPQSPPPPCDDDRNWLDLIHLTMLQPVEDLPPFGNLRVAGGTRVKSTDLTSQACANACSSLPRIELSCGTMVGGTITSISGFKKRKADSLCKTPTVPSQVAQAPAAAGASSARKRIKCEGNSPMVKSKQESHQNPTSGCSITSQSGKEACTADGTKQASSKTSDAVHKPDYIHVRARRGQATDSHSLAERVRREKISDRMKYLQQLVPGCNKITGKAGMLDEIINYVQSLQQQVEFLSMKLAAVNPLTSPENPLTSPDCFLMTKEAFYVQKVCENGIPLGMGTVVPQLLDSAYLSSNPLLRMVTSGLDTALNLQEAAALLNGAVSVTLPPSNVLGNAAFNQLPCIPPGWNVDLQCLLSDEFQQAKATLCTPFSGAGANNLQIQM